MSLVTLGISSRRTDGQDLKWILVRRILLVAVLCMSGGAILVLRDVGRDATVRNEEAAATATKQLSLQLTRIEAALDRPDRFPDWEAIVNYPLAPGQCLEYVPNERGAFHSNCQGMDMHGQISPAWFAKGYEVFSGALIVEVPLLHSGQIIGTVTASMETRAIADSAWLQLSRLIGIAGAMILAMCFLVYVAIDRSLRPTVEILAGLNRLAEGDLAHRLPRFKLKELDRISEVFNGLAKRLEATTHERSELARKLVNAQEHERQHIARELHDDVAQRLSAVNGLAASIRRSCHTISPATARKGEELVVLASGTMRSLRETLTYLRPPEIDDLGLVASVQSLVENHNRRAKGKTTFSFDAKGALDELPGETSAHVYRIIQEGLNNAARHAKAQNVKVTLTNVRDGARSTGHIELVVADDGVNLAPPLRAAKGGIGLAGIRERVYALSGTFSAGWREPHGFELHASFPVQEKGDSA